MAPQQLPERVRHDGGGHRHRDRPGGALCLPWLATIIAAVYAAGIGMDVATAGWHRLSGIIGATMVVIAVASAGLYLLARTGRVSGVGTRRLIGTLVTSLFLGAMTLGLGGVGVAFGFGRLVPIPVAPTPDDSLVAYTSTSLTGAGVIALAFLAFLWLIRPYGIDEAPDEQTHIPVR